MTTQELIAVSRKPGSVGIVATQVARIALPPEGFVLENGRSLPELEVAYETYGTLSPARDNVVLICHALSGNAHVAGFNKESDTKPGWWDEMVGPGKGIDTDHFYVVCPNILGGCKGTTGPSSIHPDTGKPYGSQFPSISIGDIVTVQRLLMGHLGIERMAGVIGGSLGGMQVLEWGIRYPDRVGKCICIASAASLSAQALAFDIVGRDAIVTDPNWAGGDYYGAASGPALGLAQARMIGHITYLSPEKMERKFGREKGEAAPAPGKFATRFQVESYLHHQGRAFVDRFDANSYLHITEAMDAYDLEERFGKLEAAFAGVQARFLVVALSSDWLFPAEQSLQVATALLHAGKHVSYCLLESPHGHDAFLLDINHLTEVVRTFLLSEPGRDLAVIRHPPASSATRDQELVASMVDPRARVLDLGCGAGHLLARLSSELQTRNSLGVDIDLANIMGALEKGLDVFHADIDQGLGIIPDNAYDYVILSETLQVVRKPQLVLREMLRVAAAGIVIFPNFATWTNRVSIGFGGMMPKSPSLPYEWYETPNIRLATLADFLQLCRHDGIAIQKMVCIPETTLGRWLVRMGLPNLGADRVLVKIGRGPGRQG